MLKINLLPSHIHTKQQVRVAIVVVTLAVAAESAFMVWMKIKPTQQLAALTERRDKTDIGVKQLTTLSGEASKAVALAAGVKPKFTFINDMLEYDRAYPNVYDKT